MANGVKHTTGDSGYVKRLLFDEKSKCIGAMGANGQVHLADIVILSTGANTAALVDAKEEIIARSHCVGVIQLTPDEAEKYKNLPIVDDFEQGEFVPERSRIAHPRSQFREQNLITVSVGILFPPDENGLLKDRKSVV